MTTAALLLSAGCVTGGRTNDPGERFAILLDSLGRDTAGLEGPAVSLTTDNDYGRYSRVSTRLYLKEDAYVTVVNVSPTGYAQIVFPADPADDAFLPGGKVYRLPSYFTGYRHTVWEPAGAAGTRFVWYGRSSNARVGARGPGYMFVIASRTPLDLQALAREGYFDELSVGATVSEMEPLSVIPRVALVATGASGRGVSFDHARYSGYDPLAYVSAVFAGGYNTAYCQTDDAPFGSISRSSWDLSYGQAGCRSSDVQRWRRRNELLTPQLPRPRWPIVPRDTTRPDSSRIESRRVKPAVDTAQAPATRVASQAVESAREQFLRIREQLRGTTSDEELLPTGEHRRRATQEEREQGEGARTSGSTPRRMRASATSGPEARPEPPAEPRRERHAERSEPRAEPRVEPRSEPRAEPRAEPAPRPERPVERPVPVERPTPEPGSR